jgi:para-nitrobenzyl esterase
MMGAPHRKGRSWPALAATLLALCLAACAAPGAGDALQRQTTAGPVLGNDDSAGSGTWSWKGVPYAQAPVGELRWRAPRDPQPWSGPRAARTFAPACVQTQRLYGPGLNNRYDETVGSALGRTVGHEDCLYLNIWTPASRPSAPRPVIVFVHGGSNITGYTADPVYDGAALARHEDAMVVTVNYRLGIFGFLDSKALKTGQREEDSGNFALLDIVKALEFVAANASAFGGDPQRVTLMGQSAGAVNVYALLTSPMLVARGRPLFHRLVALSGGLSTAASLPPGGIPAVLPAPVWAARGQALLHESLVERRQAADAAQALRWEADAGPGRTAAWLRSQSPDDLLQVVRTRLAARGMAASNPIPDGWVLAQDPIAAVRTGNYLRMPVLAGHTRDETKLFPQLFALSPALGGTSGRLLDDGAVFSLAARYDPEAPPQTTLAQWIPPVYLPVDTPGTGFDARARQLDALWFSAIRDDMLNTLRTRQNPVWAYEFEWDRLPSPLDRIFGAAHTFDLPFVFGNFGLSLYSRFMFTRANATGRLALSEAMMRSLGAFARRGDPNDAGLGASWPVWPSRLVFDADLQRTAIRIR